MIVHEASALLCWGMCFTAAIGRSGTLGCDGRQPANLLTRSPPNLLTRLHKSTIIPKFTAGIYVPSNSRLHHAAVARLSSAVVYQY